MATPKQFLEIGVVPTCNAAPTSYGLASIPPGADTAIIRVEGATCRWSETNGSFLTATTGLTLAPADPPFLITNLSAFRITALGSGGLIQVAYYSGFNI